MVTKRPLIGIVSAYNPNDHTLSPTHFVSIVRASKLAEIVQKPTLFANSMHHQGIRDLAPLLEAAAYGTDGLIEGVEVRDRTFGIGVQWHPECFAGDKHMRCIFTTLIEEAKKTEGRKRESASVMNDIRYCNHPCACSFNIPLTLSIERTNNDDYLANACA